MKHFNSFISASLALAFSGCDLLCTDQCAANIAAQDAFVSSPSYANILKRVEKCQRLSALEKAALETHFRVREFDTNIPAFFRLYNEVCFEGTADA